MVDFKKLSSAAPNKPPSTLLEVFNRLDRQVTHVELRPSQIKALKLMDARAGQRDLVLKLSTGGGKTTVGLLYLKQKMDQLRQPVVYLVPTLQLADQVINEGRRIGLNVYPWLGGVSHPPEDALTCRGVIVCTYDKFFNGMSMFGRHDVMLVPAAIVLDDVHAGIEIIRKDFSCDLPEGARTELLALLEKDLEKTDPSAWAGIQRGERRALLDVPHWILANHLPAIRKILSRHASSQEMKFAWRHLSPVLELCRVVLSGTTAHIAVDPPAVDRVSHYDQATHRLFMSASVHDGAALIRELDCDIDAAADPVQIGEEASVGERMVLVPSLIDPEFSRDELRAVVVAVRAHANVVVLVSSYNDAEYWRSAGAIVAENETIAAVIARLKSTDRGELAVFVQRYDGVDLPDKACRLLVIDGLPYGDSLIDRVDLEIAGGVIGTRGKVANRIEQGLGRAVRSASDYCAILLGGRDVAGFISRAVVLENFTPQTVRQIEIGRTVTESIDDSSDRVREVFDAVMQCLRRDAEWKDFYASQMATSSDVATRIEEVAKAKREIASFERRAAKRAGAGDYSGAFKLIESAAHACSTDKRMRGVLKQAGSKFQYHIDSVNSLRLQASAYSDNFNVARPPVLLPADVRKITEQAEGIAAWLGGFSDKNGALIELDELRAKLAFAGEYRSVEAGVRSLGEVLGGDSSRPDQEHGRGPDNLWIFGSTALVIEMKSEKTSPLSKDDAEQLQSSLLWVRTNVPKVEFAHGLIGTSVEVADNAGDFAFGAGLLFEADFIELLDRLRKLVGSVSLNGPLFSSSAGTIQKFLGSHGLLPNQILQLSRQIRQK